MYDMMREYQKKNVVIYARVSTEHEAQISALENQVDWYKPILEGHKEWTLVRSYIDEGITGTSAEKRPQFMKMMRDAKNHKFDLILTREVSRFARNTVDTLQYTRMLRSIGIEVFFINDNIKTFDGDGELRLTIMATLAQDESRKTSVRVKAGQQTSMEKGVIYGNGNVLGYDKVGKDFVINEEQAKTVRKIFDMYLEGCGFTKIRYELEKNGYKTAMGKTQWFDSTISRILRNSFYCGIMTYHKEYVPDFLEQKKVRNFGEKDFTYVQGTHTPIITEKEFFDVQSRLSKRSTSKVVMKDGKEVHVSHPVCPPTSVWSRLLSCECGNKMCRRKWNRRNGIVNYGHLCYSQANHGSPQQQINHKLSTEGKCDTPMIPEWKLELIALAVFRKYISDADKVVNLADAILTKHFASVEEPVDHSAEIEAKQMEIEKLQKKFNTFLEMRADGEITREIYTMKTDDLTTRIGILKMEIKKLQEEDAENAPEDYDILLANLRKEMAAYTDFNADNVKVIPENIVEAFISRIVIHKDSMEWYLRMGDDKTEYNTENADSFGNTTEFARVMKSLKSEPEKKHEPILVDSFKVTLEDAKKYIYSFDPHRRVQRWYDIRIDLYA